MKETIMTWKEATFCAISNSRKSTRNEESFVMGISEETAIRKFLQEEIKLSPEETEHVISEGRERAKQQSVADGQYPIWVWLEFGIGLIGLIVNIINTITAGFSFVFVCFLLTSVYLVGIAINCFLTQKGMRKAAIVWNQASKTTDVATMVKALKTMIR